MGWEGNSKDLALSPVVQAYCSLHGNYMNLCSPFIEMLIKFGSNHFEQSVKSKNYSFCQPYGTQSGTISPIFQMSVFNIEIRESKVRAKLPPTAKLFEEENCELALIQHTFEIHTQLRLAPDAYQLKK